MSRITDERGSGRPPNLAGMSKGLPSRSDWHLVVIRICVWITDHFFPFSSPLRKIGFFGHLLAFLIQSMVDLYHTQRNDWRICIHDILGQIRRTSGSVFKYRITFMSNFGIGRGLRSLSALVFYCLCLFLCWVYCVYILCVWFDWNKLLNEWID